MIVRPFGLRMISDTFLSDRQLISLVAYIAAFIMHLFLVGTNSAPCIAARRHFASTETRGREENPGRERSKKLAAEA